MGSVSGFDGLAEALDLNPKVQFKGIRREAKATVKKRDLQWFLKKIGFEDAKSTCVDLQPITPFWNSDNRDLTKLALTEFEYSPPDTLLLLMALEDQFDTLFLKTAPELKQRIFMVAHQPPAWYRLNWRDFSAFDGLGGIICLSQSQSDFFATVTKTRRLKIKHGVRSDFFCPQPLKNATSDKRLLFVGQWLRDLDLLEQAMQIIWKHQPETKLDCVIPRVSRSHPAIYRLARDARVNWHADIDANALRALYQHATLLFLPLLDSTANNAIIEALASGLPVISTKIGGVEEYVPAEAGELCAVGDAEVHARCVLHWLEDADKRSVAGASGRDFAVQSLDWSRVSADLVAKLVEVCL